MVGLRLVDGWWMVDGLVDGRFKVGWWVGPRFNDLWTFH